MSPWLNQIHHGDCLEVMRQMPCESVDLVITSPPYNLRNTTSGGHRDWGGGGKHGRPRSYRASSLLGDGYAEHHDCMEHGQYVAWQREVLAECMRLLRPAGAIFYNHKWRTQGGLLQDRSDIVEGFPVRQIIIWDRGSGFNHNRHFFRPSYEVIYFIAKPAFKLGPQRSGVGDVWQITPERNNPHPAPFPVGLPRRAIAATDAQVILDPFMGSGTTAVAAVLEGRDYIGIEKSVEYVETARQRAAETRPGVFTL